MEPDYHNLREQQWRRDNEFYLSRHERSKWASLIMLISFIVGIIALICG